MESDFVKQRINRQISSTLICSICTSVLTEPVQTVCGCRFCSKCIDNHICINGPECPNCKLEISKETIFKDKAVKKEISHVKMKCVFDDCLHTDIFRNLKKHLDICEFRQEQCDKCGEISFYSAREEHLKNLCRKTVLQCNDCGLDVIREDLEKIHKNVENGLDKLCQQLKSRCPHNCGDVIYDNIKIHLTECSRMPINCPFLTVGCDVLIARDEIGNHLQTNAFKHATFMMNEVMVLRNENENLKKLIAQINESTTEEIGILKEKNTELIMSMKNFQAKERDSCKIIENIKSDMNKYVQMVSDKSVFKDKSIQVTDDECTWIIKDIKQKCHEAKSGAKTYIISDPFYLRMPGYRMQIKIYPNGDGKGKDKYLSIYFVIAKGDYDNVISWPFKERVSLSIVSNTSARSDLAISMKPDNNEFCYGKPTNTNIGAGEPEFVSLSEILNNDRYLHSGSLKVKLKILNHKNFLSRQPVTSM